MLWKIKCIGKIIDIVQYCQCCLICGLFQYADPTDEPNSAPYDQTFEDYDLQVQEWKGEERFSHSVKISSIVLFIPHDIFHEIDLKLMSDI